jgi:ribose 5-phosphate isomerase B
MGSHCFGDAVACLCSIESNHATTSAKAFAPKHPHCIAAMVKSNTSMKIAIGADHAGFGLKREITEMLREAGHNVIDEGTNNTESTDYPDYAATVGRAVADGSADRGILVCGTGVGMAIAANKIHGVRAALAVNPEEVQLTRRHNDANVLALGANYTDAKTANEFVKLFLETEFERGGRHERRVHKIAELERN